MSIIDADPVGMFTVIDGHTAGCSYEKLNAVAASGVSACHEAITSKEDFDRLRLGLWTTLRNSSLRPDLEEIIKLITESNANTNRLLMTTDGPHPSFIEKEGFMDGLVKKAVELGVSPIQAIQMATLDPASYLRLDDYIGGIAPGRQADILILPNLVDFRPNIVISKGKVVARAGKLIAPLPEIDWNQYVVRTPFGFKKSFLEDLHLYQYPHSDPESPVPVVHFKSNVITARKDMRLPSVNGYIDLTIEKGLLYPALIERNQQWVTKGILERFAVDLDGLASTYNTTTVLLVIGRDLKAMAKASGIQGLRNGRRDCHRQ